MTDSNTSNIYPPFLSEDEISNPSLPPILSSDLINQLKQFIIESQNLLSKIYKGETIEI